MKVKCYVYHQNVLQEEIYLDDKEIIEKYPDSNSWLTNELTKDLYPIYIVNV